MIIREFDPQIYPWKLWVSIGNDFDLLKDKFYYERNKGVLDTSFIKGHEAVTYVVQNKETKEYGSLIATESKKYLTTKLIAHEATHSARDLWYFIREGNTGIEADAYLVGWIADCIWKTKNEKQ